jgi:hypothetical protein
MDCQKLDRDEIVEKYLGGKLDSAAEDEFEVHLLECARCLHAVEIVQAVTNDLAERAHEIRAQTPVQSGWLRWRWAAAASTCVVLVSVLGITWFQRSRQMPANEVAQVSSTSNPVVSPERPATKSSTASVTTSDAQKLQKIEGKAPPTVGGATDVLAVKPEKGSDVAGEKPVDMARIPPPVTQLPSNVPEKNSSATAVATTATEAHSVNTISEERAEELFRLGTVQPPPYTFSGLAASAKGGRGVDPATAVPGHTYSAATRAWFESGMNAYIDRRYSVAIENLEKAVQLEPDATDANFFLGVCKLLLGDAAGAIVPLKNAAADEKSQWAQPAHFYLAKAYVQSGDLAQAEAQFSAAAAIKGRLTTEARSSLDRVQALRRAPAPPSPR